MMITTSRAALGLAALALVGLTGCGGSDDQDSGSKGVGNGPAKSAAKDACSVTSAAAIQAVVGGKVTEGEAGTARDCQYKVTGGSLESVGIYYFGEDSFFDGIKDGYDSNRGPLTELPGIGKAAFSPGDTGLNEIVVDAGGIVFAVSANEVTSTTVHPEIKELATAIADDLD